MTETEIIRYKRTFVVEHSGVSQHFDDEADARSALVAALAAIKVGELDEFDGRVSWNVENESPLTFLDTILVEYEGQLHGLGLTTLADMSVDRDCRYLLIEENRTGGYWLTSGNDPQDLATHSEAIGGEYPEDWEIHELWDLVEKRTLEVHVTAHVDVA